MTGAAATTAAAKAYRLFIVEISGGQGRDRTADTAIFSRMLYQLSYLATAVPATGTEAEL
jgi:hypothetical protein